ncbi:hypothetical protein QNO07_16495 [Streptomyces sp. 549]|uniref:hypothetical protein n=1 Tax=Streptomyces sp. 549 TaxID=3049076 RepID=UPI0024C41779|nr:hypothetical protein [Streptomyces sp. 549]MDK1474997.1 hypothetical protein [Streptomyces sp. 549]
MRFTPRRSASAALAVSALLLVTACSGSGSGSDDAPGEKQDKAKSEVSSSPTPEKSAAELTEEQVKAAVLKTSDLPEGWKADREVSDSELAQAEFRMATADKPACQPLLDSVVASDSAPLPQQAAIAAFLKGGDDGPMLLSGVTAYKEAEAVRMTKEKPLAKACQRFTADFEGEKITFVQSQLSVPEVGEQSGGVRLRTADTDGLGSMQWDIGWTRVGGTIANVTLLSFEKSESASFDQALTKAAEKVEKAGKAPAGD